MLSFFSVFVFIFFAPSAARRGRASASVELPARSSARGAARVSAAAAARLAPGERFFFGPASGTDSRLRARELQQRNFVRFIQ